MWKIRFGTAAALVGALAVAAGIGVYLAQPAERSAAAGTGAAAANAKPLPELQFRDGAGRARSLADFRGKVVLLNVWATWCAPCREEMPALDRVQAKLGGPDFEVVALSIDQQGEQVVRKFFGEVGVKSLELMVDRAGREVGRRVGPAEWDSPKLMEELRGMIAASAR